MNHDDITQGDHRLEALFDALGTPDAVDPDVAARHVSMAAAAAAASPVASPTPEPATPWYRRVIVRAASLGLTAKILLGSAVAVAATGGAAAGGILPDPVQSFVADSASHIGLDLPNPRLETTTTTSAPATTTTTAGEATTTTVASDDGRNEATTGTAPGSYSWDATTCAGDPVRIDYTVTPDGRLQLDSVTGDPDEIDTRSDRIRVDYDGLRIDIELDDAEITIDEDRSCGTDDDDDESATTTTTTPDEGSTTTTTDPDDDSDDHSDDESDDDSHDGDESDDGDHPMAGSHIWSSTSCSGDDISVSYTVTADGELVLGQITGEVADVDEDPDRIQVKFTDGIDVDIRATDDTILEDEDRECGGDEHDD